MNKELKKKISEEISKKEYQKNEEGKIIINMVINDDSSFLSPYSSTSSVVISDEVSNFIENSAPHLSKKQDIKLLIEGEISEENKAIYKKAIKEYYLEKYLKTEKLIKRNNIISLILAVFGIIVLTASIITSSMINMLIWGEVINIVAWVLLWEATDIFLLENRKLKFDKTRYEKFLLMPIEYKKSSHNN